MFLSLISGSSGNSSLVSDGKTTLLTDCGMSCKRLEEALSRVNMTPHDLDGILITHEHSDHIKGAGVVSRKYSLPVFATVKTHEKMDIGYISEKNIKYISPGIDFEIGTLGIRPFSIPHDAAQPVGYNFFLDGGKKLSIATDIGEMTDEVMAAIRGSIAVLLEANHDPQMLLRGRYPQVLKKRILSDVGHLSNEASAQTALELIKNGTHHIMLAHLSEENNTPTLAYTTVMQFLEENGAVPDKDFALSVASRFEVSRFR